MADRHAHRLPSQNGSRADGSGGDRIDTHRSNQHRHVAADQHAARNLERSRARITLQTIAQDLAAIADRLDAADGGAA